MDGESVGDVYFAFDLLEEDGVDLRKEPYSRRLDALVAIVASEGRSPIRTRGAATGTAQKQAMFDALRRLKAEGVVFKRHAAPYTPGRPASGGDQLKLKFTATASCIVAKPNKAKRSAALELLDGGKRVAVGNVTISANQPIPKAGDIVEVRFLYAFPGGSLFQPVCLGVRDDVGLDACTIGQLKFKAADGESEETES
jgi:bifunctional non-homologous end joining protein LigD